MIEWLGRHPHLTWSFAWGVTGVGLYLADVASSPRVGPLWPAIVFGVVAWAIAGAATLCRTRVVAGLVVWSVAYVSAFYLAAAWAADLARAEGGSTGAPPFLGALAGWATAAAFAGFVTTVWLVPRARPVLAVAFSVIWGVSFLVGGYVGIIGTMYGAQASKAVFAFVGSQRLALTIGCALGAALGGLVASSIGFAARRTLLPLASGWTA